MSALVSRPTEDDAIGRTSTPPRLSVRQLKYDRHLAKARFDRLGEYLLGGLLARARYPKAGE